MKGNSTVRRRKIANGLLGAVAGLAMHVASAATSLAQSGGDEQQRLFTQMANQPTNYEVTAAFVRVAKANGDYEAAIGALERLLFYNPNLARVKYELGTLYYRLGVYELARRHFREAAASPALDAATKISIGEYLTNADRQSQPSRLAGFAQTGLRYQSNATFGTSSGLARFNGIDQSLTNSAKRAPDWNWFGVLGLSHDYDLDNSRGDILETRFVGYNSQQFKFHDLDVGIVDFNVGLRMPLPAEFLSGATIKPYLVGGNTWVDSARYLTTGGAGLQVKMPLGLQWTITPEFEWRNVDYKSSEPIPTATFATGNIFTAGVSATWLMSERTKFEARGYYRRGLAANSFQKYDQWVGEAAMTLQFEQFAASLAGWSVSPFVRYLHMSFDTANPFIDAAVVRTDEELIAGMTLNGPLTGTFGFSTTVQYGRTNSTLPNYRQDNFSVMAGPTARF